MYTQQNDLEFTSTKKEQFMIDELSFSSNCLND